MKSYPKNKSIRLKGKHWTNLKQECFIRDGFTCRQCGKQHIEDNHSLDAHHKKKRSQGGSDILDNLFSVCRFPCHREIEDRLIKENF